MKKRAFVAAAVLAALGAILFLEHKSWFFIPWVLGAFFLAGALAFPGMIRPVDAMVRYISLGIAWITGRIVMTFVFVFMIIPISLWFRLKKRDRMEMKFPGNADSYWHRRSPKERCPGCEKQY